MRSGAIWALCLFILSTFMFGTLPGFLLQLIAVVILVVVNQNEQAAKRAAAAEKALRAAARHLRNQAVLRFEQHGPQDARGAGLWDAGCAIDPDDGNALGLARERVSA